MRKIPVFPILLAAVSCAAPIARSQESGAPGPVVLTIRDHKFDPAEIRIPADRPVTLVVKNLDATPEEFESKPLRIEKIVPPNSEATFNVRPLKAGRYKFVGEFHEDTAKGEIIVE